MSHPRKPKDISTRALTGRLLALAVGMFAFGFALVPLYDVFCEVTGFGGRTNTKAAVAVETVVDESREIALEFAGPGSVAWDPDDETGGERQRAVLNSFQSGIAGGTDEIQRNIIGDRVLGLPREPAVDRGVPFRELKVGTQTD